MKALPPLGLLVVGFGRVGRRVGQIASAFGMQVSVFDRSPE
jgi:phosphoglycerate dehydrogenase-like enzyme